MPDTKNTFDSISSKYDLINEIISLKRHNKWKKDFILMLNPHGEVLDIATGTGDVALMIKNQFSKVNVTAIDPSEKMLKIAKQRNKKDDINYINAYCEDIPFSDSTFDFITISFGLRNTKSIDKSLDEIRRVLKNDGKFMIMEFSKSEKFFTKVLYKVYLNLIIPFIGLLFGKFKEYRYLASSIESFYTPSEMAKKITSKGFDVKKRTEYNLGLVTVYEIKKLNLES
tara:strand:- start:5495 stop:6175 length:681 start_codon:yes stop_codon:yes gene_type:complete